jgi:flavin-dependent dehydrogenase
MNAPRPVVLGAGISGLAVSTALSRAEIPHSLVGPKPSAGIRPGESLDLAGTLAILDMFPEHASHFRPKQAVSFTYGPQIAHVPVRVGDRFATRSLVGAMGLDAPPELLHVDRTRFDEAVHATTVSKPYCDWHDTVVEGVETEHGRVTSVRTGEGKHLPSSFVFDGSGRARLLARAFELDAAVDFSEQRLVMAHFDRPSRGEDWNRWTSLVRLSRQCHGLLAGVWCIPLEPRVSIGITAPADEAREWSDSELLTGALAALDDVGIELGVTATDALEHIGGQFTYDRVTTPVGKNWMLVGPAHRQVWWPTGAALGSILLAASLAPDFVREDPRARALHARYDSMVSSSHRAMGEMMEWADPDLDGRQLRRAVEPLVRANLARTAVYARAAAGPWATGVAHVVERIARGGRLGGVRCEVRALGEQHRHFVTGT